MQLSSAVATMFLKKIKKNFDHKKLKKPPSKVAQKISNPLSFPYCPEVPKQPKQKNSCSKMWPIDQLYIELGWKPIVILSIMIHIYSEKRESFLEARKQQQSTSMASFFSM